MTWTTLPTKKSQADKLQPKKEQTNPQALASKQPQALKRKERGCLLIPPGTKDQTRSTAQTLASNEARVPGAEEAEETEELRDAGEKAIRRSSIRERFESREWMR